MISFIIPTLNEEKYIEDTLQILSQYHGSYEIVISDGGSTDRTVVIAKRYTDKIVIHAKSHRQTIAEGRNAGSEIARGDYLVHLDADTHIPDINIFFEILLQKFRDNPKIVGATTWFRIYPHQERISDYIFYGIAGVTSLTFNNILNLSCTPGGEFQMVKSDVFKEIGMYNSVLVSMEDNEMFVRLRKRGTIYFANDLKIYHSGRRAHKLGWLKMIWRMLANGLSLALSRRSASEVWEEIR